MSLLNHSGIEILNFKWVKMPVHIKIPDTIPTLLKNINHCIILNLCKIALFCPIFTKIIRNKIEHEQ